ncbi:hypothetical protein HDU86_008146 [Geranomyces michiganensis]|nr:hypothetical protein HDU86_008146 [Geranomyces michiganensis]
MLSPDDVDAEQGQDQPSSFLDYLLHVSDEEEAETEQTIHQDEIKYCEQRLVSTLLEPVLFAKRFRWPASFEEEAPAHIHKIVKLAMENFEKKKAGTDSKAKSKRSRVNANLNFLETYKEANSKKRQLLYDIELTKGIEESQQKRLKVPESKTSSIDLVDEVNDVLQSDIWLLKDATESLETPGHLIPYTKFHEHMEKRFNVGRGVRFLDLRAGSADLNAISHEAAAAYGEEADSAFNGLIDSCHRDFLASIFTKLAGRDIKEWEKAVEALPVPASEMEQKILKTIKQTFPEL